MSELFDPDDLPDTISVRVTPKAKLEQIKKAQAEDGSVYYKVYVTAAADDGAANKAVIKLLSKALGVPKTSLVIIKGTTYRRKTIRILS